ncbi:MAG TPA: hypothetical protein VD967_01265 [Candidatus Paceibacterota bacterium]|nr:hypothetical protein [Candidatus Paceibacterota bacterium]
MAKVPAKLKRNLLIDLILVAVSGVGAVMIVESGVLETLFASSKDSALVGSFIAGFFFTSVFTVAPATAVFAEIVQTNPLWPTVLLGAFGALLGDLILFRFVRDRLAEDVMALFRYKKPGRVRAFYHSRIFHWVMPALGALIIASPLPDELGLALLGTARVGMLAFVPISYVFNALGIMLVAFVVGAV